MDQRCVTINEITSKKVKCSLIVRILSAWIEPGFGRENKQPTLELILMDDQGSKIQATIRSPLKNKYETILSDGVTCVISDFNVGLNNSKYKLTTHRYKLSFYFKTSIKIISDFRGSLNGFEFISFNDIVSYNVKEHMIVDLIGNVVGIGDVKPFDQLGRTNKRLNLELQDIDGVKIELTLFGAFVDEFSNFNSKRDPAKPIILIVQFAKTKDYNGRLTVSNAYYGSKMYINSDLSEIENFRQRLLETNTELPSINRLATKGSQLNVSSKEDLFSNCDRIPLDKITQHKKVAFYVSYATINGIVDDDEWAYIACRKCTKKVTPLDDTQQIYGTIDERLAYEYQCQKCGPSPSVYYRFKIQIEVEDETGSASFTLFDDEVIQLIKKTAYELKRSQHEEDDSLPEELYEIVGRRLLFMVSVSDYNMRNNYQVYTVSKYTDDEIIIKMFKKKYGIDQVEGAANNPTNSAANNIGLANSHIAEANNSQQDIVFINDDNLDTVDLTRSSEGRLHGKRRYEDHDKETVAVGTSSTNKRVLLEVKVEKP